MTTLAGPMLEPGDRAVVVGFGVTGRAVAAALLARGIAVTATDDNPGRAASEAAESLDLELVAGPDEALLHQLSVGAAAIVPTPGLPDRHVAFVIARELGVPIMSEFDLARMWDDRPLVAITGTDGKTTVTTMVTEMFRADGTAAEAVGNTDVPLVAAIDDPATAVFVVEASSFRLGHSARFAPDVATWLNFAPDHLDVHESVAAYERAKAAIWRDQRADQTAVGNAEDPIVMRNMTGAARRLTYGLSTGDSRVVDGHLMVDGETLMPVGDLTFGAPHHVSNSLAAATTAAAAGVSHASIVEVLSTFRGLPHRVELIATVAGVDFYDDSKATTPHATLAAVAGFDSAVLIAGGRNKGLDLAELAAASRHLRHVVAIGEAAGQIEAAFSGRVSVSIAQDMDEAVEQALSFARSGDSVVLSPACASFDWYGSYRERGDDFVRAVRSLVVEAS